MGEAFCRRIDAINERIGGVFAWLFIPLTLLVITDVFTRYILNDPWYYIDINIQVMGCIALMGLGFTHRYGGHIGVDVFVNRLSPRARAILDLILFPLFLAAVGAVLWRVSVAAFDSLRVLERYSSTLLPPIYPYKTMMVVGVALLLLQGIAKFIRDIGVIRSGGKP